MGDNAEFEKLTTLEARLAAALDRIAAGLGDAAAAPQEPLEDPGLTSGALEDAQIRADAAEARVAELQAELAQAKDAAPALDPAVLVTVEGERDEARARITALEAEREEMTRTLAEKDSEMEVLRGERAAALEAATHAADSADPDETAALKSRITELQGRIDKLRKERAEAKNDRDEARDIAEELQAASGATPDDRAMALRQELQDLRAINDRLSKNLSRMRSENASDPETLNKALVVELDALKAARASEAAELERILADLEPALQEGGASHA